MDTTIELTDNNNVLDFSALQYGIKQALRYSPVTLYAYECDNYAGFELCHLSNVASAFQMDIIDNNIKITIDHEPVVIYAHGTMNDKIGQCATIQDVELLLNVKLVKCSKIRQAKYTQRQVIDLLKYQVNYNKYLDK